MVIMGLNASSGRLVILQGVVAIITIIAAVGTYILWMDARHASKTSFEVLEHSFQTHELNGAIIQANERVWQLGDRLTENPDDVSAREELRSLKAKVDTYRQEYES